jgi:hypothetical protein
VRTALYAGSFSSGSTLRVQNFACEFRQVWHNATNHNPTTHAWTAGVGKQQASSSRSKLRQAGKKGHWAGGARTLRILFAYIRCMPRDIKDRYQGRATEAVANVPWSEGGNFLGDGN